MRPRRETAVCTTPTTFSCSAPAPAPPPSPPSGPAFDPGAPTSSPTPTCRPDAPPCASPSAYPHGFLDWIGADPPGPVDVYRRPRKSALARRTPRPPPPPLGQRPSRPPPGPQPRRCPRGRPRRRPSGARRPRLLPTAAGRPMARQADLGPRRFHPFLDSRRRRRPALPAGPRPGIPRRRSAGRRLSAATANGPPSSASPDSSSASTGSTPPRSATAAASDPSGRTPTADATLETLGAALARRCRLRGLFGVDGVVRDGAFWPVEVNPRYTASVEILEYGGEFSAIAWHRAAFVPTTPRPAPPSDDPTACVGKAVLFAPGDLAFPADGPWNAVLRSPPPCRNRRLSPIFPILERTSRPAGPSSRSLCAAKRPTTVSPASAAPPPNSTASSSRRNHGPCAGLPTLTSTAP